MNTERPSIIAPPPDGWIYLKGPLRTRYYGDGDLMIFYHGEWQMRTLRGNSPSHYALRAGSEIARQNGLIMETPEQLAANTPHLRSLIEKCNGLGGTVIMLSRPYKCEGGKVWAKGPLKKAVRLMLNLNSRINDVDKTRTTRRFNLMENSSGDLDTVPQQWAANGPAILAMRISDSFRTSRHLCIMVPRHLGISQQELDAHNTHTTKFHLI